MDQRFSRRVDNVLRRAVIVDYFEWRGGSVSSLEMRAEQRCTPSQTKEATLT